MISVELLAKLQQNPQMMEQLVNSPIDPNAIMAYQMGGAMPEMPGVHMGQGGAVAPPVQGAVPPPSDVWSQMGSGMPSPDPVAPRQTGASPMMRFGDAPAMKPGNFSSRGPAKQTNSLEDILAGFRK